MVVIVEPNNYNDEYITQEDNMSEKHAYNPNEESSKKEQASSEADARLIVDMTEDQFLELMVRAVIKADRIKDDVNHNEDYFEDDVDKHPVASVLGVVGNMAHGVVDIAEGVVRGAVDIVTFGQSRSKR